jgi:hypothetical protein
VTRSLRPRRRPRRTSWIAGLAILVGAFMTKIMTTVPTVSASVQANWAAGQVTISIDLLGAKKN